jgi:hypothetical protein
MEASGSKGQVSKINKAFSKVVTRPCYQTQNLSMTESNFLFLLQQKKYFLRKVTFSTGSLCAKNN